MLHFLSQVAEGDIDGAIEQVLELFYAAALLLLFVLTLSSFMLFSIRSRHLPRRPNACGRTNGTASVSPHYSLDSDGLTMRVLPLRKPSK